MKFMETIKEHPYLTAGGVFIGGALIIVLLFSGNKATAAVTNPSVPATDTTGATQVALAGIQANAATTIAATQSASQDKQTAAAVSIAQLAAATQQNSDNEQWGAQIALAGINKDTVIGSSTIQAQALMHQSDNDLAAAQSNAAAGIAVAGINAASNNYITDSNNKVAGYIADINAASNNYITDSNNKVAGYIADRNNDTAYGIAGINAAVANTASNNAAAVAISQAYYRANGG